MIGSGEGSVVSVKGAASVVSEESVNGGAVTGEAGVVIGETVSG